MDDPHPSHRFLSEPPWASGARPARTQGLDLSDQDGRVPSSDVVRRAARNVSPLSLASPSALMLREAIAKVHGVDVAQVFPRASISELMSSVCAAFIGPDARVALTCPCRPEFIHHVLRVGGRYVDIGRDSAWAFQSEAFERVLTDGEVHAAILGRPDVPSGSVSPLVAVRQALHAGLLVVVDETLLAYADPSAGLPRPTTSRSDTALTLFDDDGTPTDGLIVVRKIPGLGAVDLVYAVAEPKTAARLWRIDPRTHISAPVAAGAWIALDHTAHARRVIVERTTTRSELRTALRALRGYTVPSSQGASLLVGRPGVIGSDLAAALAHEGLTVATSNHPSWRDHVAVGLPLASALDRITAMFEAAAAALDGA